MPAESLTKREIAAAVLGTAVHGLSLAGELSKQMGTLACCIVPFAWLGAVFLGASASTTKRRLLLLLQPALTALVWMHLMRGVPYFVHRDADPLIAAIRHYHDMHGIYPPGGIGERETPPELLLLMNGEAWCFYSAEEDDDCRVMCMGIGFNHAVYRFSTDSWWVGD
jgi:hypothetical protein